MKVRTRKQRQRNGVTAVEFALVAPVIFLFVFTIFEIARLMMLGGNVNTAMLQGARHSTLADSTATEVDEIIRAELKKFGISEAQVNITPNELTEAVQAVEIDVEVPVGTTFGIEFSNMRKNITIDRE